LINYLQVRVRSLTLAHVYLRFKGDITTIPPDLLQDVGQLTKANSIEGNKKSVKVVYTKSTNLLKDGSMDTGQVAFKDSRQVKKISVPERLSVFDC
jgi:NFACT protein RNA binding domain